jgi:predicted  nucleic acid-binding Zn-ribbon protein
MSVWDNLKTCRCGEIFKKEQSVCESCGRNRFRMSIDSNKEDNIMLYEKNIRNAKKIAEIIYSIQFAKQKGQI